MKVDRSLLAPRQDGDAQHQLLSGIVGLAHRIGSVVVAEGIETESQREIALEAGCDALQGYLLGRPAPAAESRRLARADRPVLVDVGQAEI